MIKILLVSLIRLYQFLLSPALRLLPLAPSACRFEPSCSTYSIRAIRRFGAVRGLWLSLRRLCRCHPFCAGGSDPLPPL